MSAAKKLSKTRKLAIHREVRKMTGTLDSCAEYPERLDVVDLLANLDRLNEFMAKYRRLLVKEAKSDPTTSEKFDHYFNSLAHKALREVGQSLQAAFEANPDLLRGDVIDVSSSVAPQPALEPYKPVIDG